MRLNTLLRMVVILTLPLLFSIVVFPVEPAYLSLRQEHTLHSTGEIIVQNNFVSNIFFEYGAESGSLSPFSQVQTGGIIGIDDIHARTGSKAIYFWQKAPPKTDMERRCHLRLFGRDHQKNEGYLSWWVWFGENNAKPNQDWGPVIGGLQLFYGPEDDTTHWWVAMRFSSTQNSRHLRFCFSYSGDSIFSEDAESLNTDVMTDFNLADLQNQWVHFQIYFKFAEDGAYKAWINNILVAEDLNVKADPAAFPEWNSNPVDGGQTYYRSTAGGGPYPRLTFELYQGPNSYENWMWVDDIVFAYEKVPENYSVG